MAEIMTDAMNGAKSNNSTFLKCPTRPKPDSPDLRTHLTVSLSVCMTVDHQDEYPSREWVCLHVRCEWVRWTGPLPCVVCLAVAIDALNRLVLLFGQL